MDASKVKRLRQIVDHLKELNGQVDELKAEKAEIESNLLEDMHESEVFLAQTPYGTVSMRETDVASVKDWDAFEKYIYDNHALYLLQRRPSDPAYRDEVKANGDVPGVETFTKKTVSLTKAVR